jgi:hypothetical protein
VESALYNIIWTSLAEDEKSLIFSEFKDRLYTFIANSLDNIDRPDNARYLCHMECIPKDNASQPAFSGNKQLHTWKSMMDKLFLDVANKLKQQLTSEQNGECEEIAGYLASCWLHEDIPENRACFAKEFVRIFKSQEIKDFIIEISDRTKNFFTEVIADVYMCCLLGLGKEEYLNLVYDFFRFSYGIDPDDLPKNNTGNGNFHDAVTIQARVWMILTGFNCQSDKDMAHVSRQMSQDVKERETMEFAYNRIKSFIKEIRGEYLFEYMDEVFDFCNNELLGKYCPELNKLRKNYRELSCMNNISCPDNKSCPDNGNPKNDNCDNCDKISRQFQFIEYYWLKGISQIIDERNKQKGVLYEYC